MEVDERVLDAKTITELKLNLYYLVRTEPELNSADELKETIGKAIKFKFGLDANLLLTELEREDIFDLKNGASPSYWRLPRQHSLVRDLVRIMKKK